MQPPDDTQNNDRDQFNQRTYQDQHAQDREASTERNTLLRQSVGWSEHASTAKRTAGVWRAHRVKIISLSLLIIIVGVMSARHYVSQAQPFVAQQRKATPQPATSVTAQSNALPNKTTLQPSPRRQIVTGAASPVTALTPQVVATKKQAAVPSPPPRHPAVAATHHAAKHALPIVPVNAAANQQLMHWQGYTLQLVAAHHVAGIQKLLPALAGRALIVRTSFQHKPWSVLVYGSYATAAEALHARSQLPPALQHFHPWVRSVASLQRWLPQRPQHLLIT